MSHRGRSETPMAVAELRGDAKASKLSKRGFIGHPIKPHWLSNDARSVWCKIEAFDGVWGWLTEADSHVLAMYCEVVSQYIKVVDHVVKQGPLMKDLAGRLVANPALKAQDMLVRQVKTLATELGFTPAARKKVEAPPKKDPQKDELEEFIADEDESE